MERWLVKDKRQAEFFNKFVLEEAEAGRERLYTIVRANRSNKQNNTLHLLLRNMATDLNEAGFEIPYTEHSVKELLWLPIIKAMFGETSSTQLDTAQFSEAMTTLVDAVNRNTGVYTPIPQELTNGPS